MHPGPQSPAPQHAPLLSSLALLRLLLPPFLLLPLLLQLLKLLSLELPLLDGGVTQVFGRIERDLQRQDGAGLGGARTVLSMQTAPRSPDALPQTHCRERGPPNALNRGDLGTGGQGSKSALGTPPLPGRPLLPETPAPPEASPACESLTPSPSCGGRPPPSAASCLHHPAPGHSSRPEGPGSSASLTWGASTSQSPWR